MIYFSQPWAVLLCCLIPGVVYFIRRPHKQDVAVSLTVPFFRELSLLQTRANRRHSRWLLSYICLVWVFLTLAAAGPYQLGKPVGVPIVARNILLAIDTSDSMSIPDMIDQRQRRERITVVKKVAERFIKARAGDRVGLILFGSQAYLQAPLTLDRETLTEFLAETEVRLAGPQTALGNAIGLAIKHLGRDQGEKVLILLTDGVDNASVVPPRKMSELAQKSNIKIYTIGFGSLENSESLDEETLQSIATTTGGRYFRAKDPEDLNHIYSLINQLEPVNTHSQIFRHTTLLYPWPLATALLLSFFLALWYCYIAYVSRS